MNALKSLSYLMMTAALLTSCQRAAEYKTTTYQEKTNATLAKIANTISKPIEEMKSSMPKLAMLGIRGLTYDPSAGMNFSNSPSELMDTCLTILQQYGPSITNQAALSIIDRCGMALFTWGNRAVAVANGQLNYAGKAWNGYNISYPRPLDPYGQFEQGYSSNFQVQTRVNNYTQYGNPLTY